MGWRDRIHRINGPHILWLIRERKVQDLHDLESYFITPEFTRLVSRSKIARLRMEIRANLKNLVDAGLVEQNNESVASTQLLDKVQTSLDISLTELAKSGPNSILANPVFGRTDSSVLIPDVFVLMPFTKTLQPVYEDSIRRVCSQLTLTVARADDFFTTESIVSDIWKAIYNSRVTIADCTERNPNVFYEVGIAHTIGKPTILVAQDIDDIPFDLRHIRCIVYEYTPRGMFAFEEALSKTLEGLTVE